MDSVSVFISVVVLSMLTYYVYENERTIHRLEALLVKQEETIVKQDIIVSRLTEKTLKQENQINNQEERIYMLRQERGKLGETYIRWGRTVCPQESAIVYHGYAAGKHYNLGGSGANFLCLPEDPEWKDYADGQGATGRIYGVQYAVHDGKPYNTETFDKKDMPCAVCMTSKRLAVQMIPAKLSCPKEWHKEFSGYLMSQFSSNSRTASQYICVDENLEVVHGAIVGDWQAAIYPVEVGCGRLSCPPYINGRELTCVVCST